MTRNGKRQSHFAVQFWRGGLAAIVLSGLSAFAQTTFTTYLGTYGSGVPTLQGATVTVQLRAYDPSGANKINYLEAFLENASSGAIDFEIVAQTNGAGGYTLRATDLVHGVVPDPSLLMSASGTTQTISPAISTGTLQITAYRFAIVNSNEMQLDVTLTRTGAFNEQIVVQAYDGTKYSSPPSAVDGYWNATSTSAPWTVNPTALSFPSQTVGTASAAAQIAVNVTSGSAVSLTASLSGSNSADFSAPASANSCNAVAVGSNCVVGVWFKPSAAGTRTATLTLKDGSGNSMAVSLTGAATAAASGAYITGITLYAPTSGQIYNAPGIIVSPINCQQTPTATAYASTNAVPVGAYCATVNVSGLNVTSGTVSITGVTHPGASSNTIAAAVLATTATSIIYASAEPVAADGTIATVNVTANGVTISQTINVGTPNALVSYNGAARLLEQAAFGPTHDDIVRVQQLGISGWISNQFNVAPVNLYVYNDILGAAPYSEGIPAKFLIRAVGNPAQLPTFGGGNNDQLRQRVAFALSQLFVISANDLGEAYGHTYPHENMLYNDAFSNYTQLLTDVTLSPPMGEFLNMAGSRSQASSGFPPNQNYGREVLQLFSIGLTWLDMSGNPTTPPVGYSTAPYGQNEVINFANLFTGWNETGTTVDPKYCDSASAANPGANVCSSMLVGYPPYHDWTAKTLLSYPNPGAVPAGCPSYNQINANTNTSTQTAQAATTELTCALANIANHPNVPPFFSRFLIQHLVTSNPSAGYINRVATAFKNSSGDMKTTLTAILTDPEARDGDTNLDYQNKTDPYLVSSGVDFTGYGHLKEPLLSYASYFRAVGAQAPTNSYVALWDGLFEGQQAYAPPSVFNFYSPFYALSSGLVPSPPKTANGSFFGPEFQIFTAATSYQRLLTGYGDITILCGCDGGTAPEFVAWNQFAGGGTQDFGLFVSAAVAGTDTLLDAVDAAFTHGHMDLVDSNKNTLRAEIAAQLAALGGDKILQAKQAVYLANLSPYNQVTH